MTTLTASVPSPGPPAWAVLERQLFALLNESVHPFMETYTNPDGTLLLESSPGGSEDDFYEPFYNWPLLYLLGGGEALLELGDRQWDAVTAQLTRFGLVRNEYPRRDDQFHQGEGDIYFYLLCLADPANPKYHARARRFAGLYMDEDADARNYDARNRLIRGPHTGSDGPGVSFFGDREPAYGWSPGMARYGIPYYDVPGVTCIDDLKDADKARRMGELMERRMSRGDVVSNLAVTSLVMNAYLLTGEEKYRKWILDYVEGWIERARQNDGLLPDNVGLSGRVGEYIDGKWYGGLYGWTWPHGFYNIQMVAVLAAANAYLLTRDEGYLELPRIQMDRIVERGAVRDLRTCDMSLHEHWIGQYKALGDQHDTFVVPYRYGDVGWFDYQPLSPAYPVALWNLSMRADDWERIERLRRMSRYDWTRTFPFHTKEDGGHEPPWVRFLAGDNPAYPEDILRASCHTACRRLALIRGDDTADSHHDVHRWQAVNPVTTEGLIQLTMGAPQLIYNGGLLMARLRYFDAERKRPGLPDDVAALVDVLEGERTRVHLVNLSPVHPRTVILQGGAFGEHTFTEAAFNVRTSAYPGDIPAYAAPEAEEDTQTATVNDNRLRVVLPPGMEIRIDLGTHRFANRPSYTLP